jgi:hypothetical protein
VVTDLSEEHTDVLISNVRVYGKSGRVVASYYSASYVARTRVLGTGDTRAAALEALEKRASTVSKTSFNPGGLEVHLGGSVNKKSRFLSYSSRHNS